MNTHHTPVLLAECLDALDLSPGKTIVDATLGFAGHASAIAERIAPGGTLVGIDRDTDALAASKTRLETIENVQIHLHHGTFDTIPQALAGAGRSRADGVLMDLGVSSFQLDTPGRGFAIRYQGPLDMRMDTSGGITAAELLNTFSEAQIVDILFRYGEESRARRIAAEIVKARPLKMTEDLVDCVRRAMPFRTRPGEIHPATKVFQAVRIAVNGELDLLSAALIAAIDCLSPGGRLVVMSYHSLEDRIVKTTLATESGKRINTDFPSPTPEPDARLELVTRKPVSPTESEIRDNPRSRSARLRVAQKL